MRIIFNAPVSLSLVFGSLGVLALAVLAKLVDGLFPEVVDVRGAAD